MSVDPRLVALADLAGTLRESRLAQLRLAEDARRAAAAALAALPAGAMLEDDGPAAAAVAGAQMRWLLEERGRRSAALAASTAHALDARAGAARALGRAEALRRLAGRQG